MTKKRFTVTQDFEEHHRQIRDNGHIIMGCFLEAQAEPIVKLLNELHEENQSLKFDNKELIRFITSKGYTLQDYIEFIGQFQSLGVNKRDWESKRFMIDDAGTLIDMETRNTYDYVEEVCPLLNELNEELNDFDFTHTNNCLEFDRDKLHFRDRHIRVDLHNRDLKIYINLPGYKEFFNYTVTGKTLTRGYEELKK